MSNKINTPEHDRQRRLTYLAAGTALATPILGPFALVAGGAIIAGKVLRNIFNTEAKKDYTIEKRIIQQESNQRNNYLTTYDTTETALARSNPLAMLKLLKNEEKRKEYTFGLAEGASIVNEYSQRMDSKERDSITEIIINPEYQKKFLGIPYGKKQLEVIIKDDI